MADVFISYAREDAARIKTIAESLKLLGLEVWFDERIPSGSSFNEIIWQELEGAKAILVGWSGKSCRSTWVMSEAMVGQKNDKLVAFFLESCTLIPPFNLAQAEDLADWRDDWTSHGWRKIVERIGSLVGRPALVGQPGAPGLCEALADRSGHQLAVWARAYPDDPYAGKIGPVWERRQRESFAVDLANARKQVDGLLKKRQTQTKANFATLESEFEAWVAQGPAARPNERPDPRSLAASLVGPLGKKHGATLAEVEVGASPPSPAEKPEPDRRTETSSAPAKTETPAPETGPTAIETPPSGPTRAPRAAIWRVAATLLLGALLGGGAAFLGVRPAKAPDPVAENGTGLTALREDDARAKADLAGSAKANEALRHQASDMTNQLADLRDKLDASESAKTSLTQQLNESRGELRSAQAQVSEGSSRDATVRALESAKKTAESERDSARGDLDLAQRQVESLTTERNDLKSQLDERSTALQSLQDQMQALRTSSERDLGGAREQIAVLRYQLAQAGSPGTTTPPQERPSSRSTCIVSGTDPNGYGWIALRYAPSKSSKWSTTHLTEGMHVDVLARSGEYWRVRVGNEEGYASSQFIRCE